MVSSISDLSLRAFGTGFGIIIGNSIIKYFTNRKEINEAKKIFSFAIEEQLSSLSAMVVSLDKIRFLLEENYSNITQSSAGDRSDDAPDQAQNTSSQSQLELRNNAVVIQQTVEQILENNFYKQLLGEQRIFKADLIAITGKYFSKLQKYLVSLKLFFSNLPIEESETHQEHDWREREVLLEKLDWFITHAEATIDRGNMSKIVLDRNKLKDGDEVEELASRFHNNEECSRFCDRKKYLEPPEFDEIKEFIAQRSASKKEP